MLRQILLVVVLIAVANSEYIPPGPTYPCPKDENKNLLHPCVCEKGADEGLHIRCENAGLALLSIGLGNIASLNMPIEKLVLKDCKISTLFGPIFHRSSVKVMEITDTPIKTIETYAFAGVNRTLQEIYMTNTKISEFPKDAFKILGNLKILSIDGHQMTKLDKDIFSGSQAVDKLERLHLINGQIADIAVDVFQNLKKVKFLDLHGNRLVTLKKNQFKGLRDAEVLDISYNNITKLDGTHTGDLTKLGWCNASHNQIGDIPRGMFARNQVLKVVHLDNNKIKKLDTNTFKGMRLLRRLHLQDNEISDVGRGTFSSLTRIGTIDLARNRITKIDFQMFQTIKYAELVNLAENQITLIENKAFTDLYQTKVNISYNQLASIEAGAFINCNNLTLLDLSHNQLQGFNKSAFDENTYAFEFDVTFNQLTDFGQIPIQNMTGIRVLNASYNAITQIPRNAFPKLYELHTVDVSHNNLSEIYSAVFQNLFSLRNLDLSYNSLEQIKPATFGTIPTLLQLDLSHNMLRDVSRGSLFKLPSCRVLDISHNKLEKIFEIPISLGELNFAHNRLSSIPINTWPSMNALLRLNLSSNVLGDQLDGNSFLGLLTLQSLDLSNNGLTRPPWQALNTLTSLQYLYMQYNNLTELSKSAFGNLPTMFHVDLSYNMLRNISQNTFHGLQQLLDLSLRGNNLSYIPNEAFKSLVALRKLDLSHNNLDKIDNKTNGLLDDCLSLEAVNLSHNRFGFLTKKMFPSNPWIPYRLLEVDLSYNEIPVITLHITQGTKKLKKLNLSGNVINDIKNDVLGNMTSLEVLDLSHNQLRDLISITSEAKFHLPGNITHLYLQNNLLSVIPLDHIVKADRLQVLDVRNNRLTSFDPELVKKVKNGMDIYFEGNQLNCDCFARPLKHYLNHLSPSAIRTDDKYVNLTCTEPLPLENEKLLTVDEDRLLCAGNIETQERIKHSNTEGEFYMSLVTEPELAFRDIEFTQETIIAQWFVISNEDVADFFIYIRDGKNELYYSTDISYNLRTLSITIDEKLRTSLQKGGKYEICIQAKDSRSVPRNWFASQCQELPNNFGKWPKKIATDLRSLIKRRFMSSSKPNSTLGMVSDSILLTLCIFLGACFRRLYYFDI